MDYAEVTVIYKISTNKVEFREFISLFLKGQIGEMQFLEGIPAKAGTVKDLQFKTGFVETEQEQVSSLAEHLQKTLDPNA